MNLGDLGSVIEFAENPEPRCPLILLLDTSGSMNGEAINELNAGVEIFKQEIHKDSTALSRVEVAIITFGGQKPELVEKFINVRKFCPTRFKASGVTPMIEAIELALDTLENRKQEYKDNGIDYYQPWLFLITDGEPTDEDGYPTNNWYNAAKRLRQAQEDKKLNFFAIAVKGANIDILRQMTVNHPPLMLNGLNFRKLFRWISASATKASIAKIGAQVTLPDNDWAFNIP